MAVDPEVTGGRVPSFQSKYGNPMGPGSGSVQYVQSNPAAANNAVYLSGGKYAYMGSQSGKDLLMDVQGADVSYYFLPDAARKEMGDYMDGLYGKGQWQESWLHKPYGRALQASAYAYQNLGKRVTALDALKMLVKQEWEAGGPAAARGGAGNGASRYTGPVTTTQTQTSVNLTDPGTARKLVDDALSQALGRAANDKERQRFMQALAAQERANPSVTEATSTTTPMGPGRTDVRSSTVSAGGFNPSTFAQEWAEGQEGSGEYRAATTLLNSFMQSLRGVI